VNSFFDYVPGNSLLHRLNPLTKLLLAVFLCVACFVSDYHLVALAVIILSLAMAANAGMLTRALSILRALAKLSLLLFLLQVLFIRQGQVWLELPWQIVITDRGVAFSLLIVLRLVAATLPLCLMLSVTKMSDLANALVKAGVPYKYAYALTAAIRFIPVFTAEMHSIMQAQTSRGVEFDTKNIFKKIGLILPLCVPLLVSSVRRINQSAIAVRLRGFDERTKRSGYKEYRFQAADCGVIAFSLLVVAASVLLG